MIDIGDKVEFDGRRGRVRGTVTDVKHSRPGSRNQLARAYGLSTPTVRKLVVLPDDGSSGVWTVPETMCRKIGKGDVKAISKSREILNQIANKRAERAYQGRETADTAGLYDLKKGDPIEVKFREGWFPKKFSHMSANGRVGFFDGSRPDPLGIFPDEKRVRFVAAQFVRKPTDEASAT